MIKMINDLIAITTALGVLVFNALIIWGVFYVTASGMIFGFVDRILPGRWIRKPLFDCPVCMSSVWGGLGYLAGVIWFGWHWYLLPVYIVALAGFMAVTNPEK